LAAAGLAERERVFLGQSLFVGVLASRTCCGGVISLNSNGFWLPELSKSRPLPADCSDLAVDSQMNSAREKAKSDHEYRPHKNNNNNWACAVSLFAFVQLQDLGKTL
jgi:hypothetical protein